MPGAAPDPGQDSVTAELARRIDLWKILGAAVVGALGMAVMGVNTLTVELRAVREIVTVTSDQLRETSRNVQAVSVQQAQQDQRLDSLEKKTGMYR